MNIGINKMKELRGALVSAARAASLNSCCCDQLAQENMRLFIASWVMEPIKIAIDILDEKEPDSDTRDVLRIYAGRATLQVPDFVTPNTDGAAHDLMPINSSAQFQEIDRLKTELAASQKLVDKYRAAISAPLTGIRQIEMD